MLYKVKQWTNLETELLLDYQTMRETVSNGHQNHFT